MSTQVTESSWDLFNVIKLNLIKPNSQNKGVFKTYFLFLYIFIYLVLATFISRWRGMAKPKMDAKPNLPSSRWRHGLTREVVGSLYSAVVETTW